MQEIKEIEDIVKYVSRSVLMLYYQKVQAQNKADGSLITQADIDVMQRIKNQLAESFPQYQFFSEELPEEELNRFFQRTTLDIGVWILSMVPVTLLPASLIFLSHWHSSSMVKPKWDWFTIRLEMNVLQQLQLHLIVHREVLDQWHWTGAGWQWVEGI